MRIWIVELATAGAATVGIIGISLGAHYERWEEIVTLSAVIAWVAIASIYRRIT